MKKVILAVVMAGILLVGMIGTAFANPVAWDLDSSGNGTEASPYVMNHQSAGIAESGSFLVAANSTVYLRSNTSNAVDTSFPDFGSTDWRLYFYTTGTSVSHLSATIGTWSGGTFNADGYQSGGLNSTSFYWDGLSDEGYLNFDQSGAQSVSGSEYMAIMITCDASDSVEIITENTGPNSYLFYYGTENPEWPVPEIATIIMIALGVMAIGGFVWMRRRQPAQVVA